MTLEVIGYWSTLEQDSLRNTRGRMPKTPFRATVLLSGAESACTPHPKLDAPRRHIDSDRQRLANTE